MKVKFAIQIQKPLGVLDWSKSDSELGRIHGRSRERIRQLRKKAGQPPAPKLPQYAKFKPIEDVVAYIKANPSIAIASEPEALAKKIGTCKSRVAMAMRILGLRRQNEKESIFKHMNFDLPSSALERIWKIKCAPTQKIGQRVSVARRQLGMPASKWDARIPKQRNSAKLKAAIEKEEARAKLYLESQGE